MNPTSERTGQPRKSFRRRYLNPAERHAPCRLIKNASADYRRPGHSKLCARVCPHQVPSLRRVERKRMHVRHDTDDLLGVQGFTIGSALPCGSRSLCDAVNNRCRSTRSPRSAGGIDDPGEHCFRNFIDIFGAPIGKAAMTALRPQSLWIGYGITTCWRRQ